MGNFAYRKMCIHITLFGFRVKENRQMISQNVCLVDTARAWELKRVVSLETNGEDL